MASTPEQARRPREQTRPLPPLPHPSWEGRLEQADEQASLTSAREFWERLGL